jgi:hypothetical protein
MKISTVLAAGIAIREAFSFWTGHPFDFELWVRLGYYTVRGVSPYGVLPAAPGLSFTDVFSISSTATIGYLPFWPFVTGVMYWLYTLVGFGNRFVYYFLLKQPVIIGDIAVAYLLYLIVKRERPEKSLWAAEVWAFLPLSIIFSGIWGMFDSLAMALVLAAFLSSSASSRSLLSGLATFAKSIPLIFAIPLTLGRGRRWWGILVAVLVPASLTVGVSVAMGWSVSSVMGVVGSTVGKGGGSMSVFAVLGYLQYLGVLTPQALDQLWILNDLWIPAVIVGTVVAARRFGLQSDSAVTRVMLVATLMFLIFKSQVNEQYYVYLLALGLLDVCLIQPKRIRLIVATAATVTVYLLANNVLLIRFLAPIYPQATLIDFTLDIQYSFLRSTLALVAGLAFTALNVAYLIWLWKDSSPRGQSAANQPAEVTGLPGHDQQPLRA